MTVIETTTLIICAVLIVMGFATPMVSIFFRKVRLSDDPDECQETIDEEAPAEENAELEEKETTDNEALEQKGGVPLSVVLFAHDNARDLERHLPALLTQHYEPGFEVIVVEGKSEDDTDDVLKRLKQQYSNLYTTFVPESARYMSRNKLAITLGVKAAKNQWIVLTEPTCHPASERWLEVMARNCTPDYQMVMGYSCYEEEASHFKHFKNLWYQRYLMREAQRGTAYRSEPGNLMFRKDMFLDGRTFEGNLMYIRGEYDFIVNKFATSSNTVTETHPDGWMIQDEPTNKQWTNHHLFYMETRQHLSRTLRHRCPVFFDQFFLHATLLLQLLAIAVAVMVLAFGVAPQYAQQALFLLVAAVVSFIASITLRIVFAKKAFSEWAPVVPAWKVVPFELSLPWRFLRYKIRYALADKYDFICHKV